MKSKLYVFCALLLLGVSQNPTLKAMDDDRKVEQGPITQLSDDLLLHILSFVVDKDPSSAGNLLKIKQASKMFEALLTPKEMQMIAGLTQANLRLFLINAVQQLDAKKVRLWIKFGAQATSEEIRHTLGKLFEVVFKKRDEYERRGQQVPVKYNEDNVLEITKMLFEFDGVNKDNPELLAKLSRFGWYKTVKYMLDHGISINARALRLAVQYDHPETVQLLLDYGANPNVGVDFGHGDNKSPLYYTQSQKVASILLDAGAQLYVQCGEGEKTIFSDMVIRAMETNNASMLIEVLKKNYGLKTATAIALALMAGASVAGMMCTIL